MPTSRATSDPQPLHRGSAALATYLRRLGFDVIYDRDDADRTAEQLVSSPYVASARCLQQSCAPTCS